MCEGEKENRGRDQIKFREMANKTVNRDKSRPKKEERVNEQKT